ncbi:MAG: protein translocase subunit SecD [Pseudomonadota bacterium]
MNKLSWRIALIGLVLITACVLIIPSLGVPVWWPNVFPLKKINLGLDLKGGMDLELEVESEKAVVNALERVVQELKQELIKGKIKYRESESLDTGGRFHLTLLDAQQVQDFESILKDSFPLLAIESQDSVEAGLTYQLAFTPQEMEEIKIRAVKQATETIRNRIDQFGVSEPEIQSNPSENRILIQLPGVKDPRRATELIQKTAQLEFKLVDEGKSVEEALKGTIPDGDEILYKSEIDPVTNKETKKTPYLLKKRTFLTGEYLTDARVQFQSNKMKNEPYVAIEFDHKGAKLFEDLTGANVQKRLAIVLDNKVHSAPVIRDKIAGGRASIEGNFTAEEAHDLAIVLRAGSLPAPIHKVKEHTVGPSLGQDSIRSGIFASVLGALLVILFMAIYYKVSGIIANIALIFNVLLILAALAAFQATLTLPGIAGIILTMGMAVDANVIIYERMRDELRLGKTFRAALEAGYEKGALPIIDANITTLIAGLVLYQFGTGPIKGFAVTLSIGIITTLFTALTVTKIMFDYLLYHAKVKEISV